MPVQDRISAPASTETRRDLAKGILAAGGLLAAFGVASCCALPVALSMLGIGAASIVGIGIVAAQYQQELFYAAAAMLFAGAFVMWREGRARACTPGAACTRPIVNWGSKAAMLLAVGLLALTFWIEPPV